MDAFVARDRLKKRFANWDDTGRGTLERSDLVREGDRIARAFGVEPTSPEARRLRCAFSGIFDYFSDHLDGCSSISEEQLLYVGEGIIHKEDEDELDRLLRPMMEAIVRLCDENVVGQINEFEFTAWLGALGVPRARARRAFRRIDELGYGEVTIDELLAAVRDYHLGDLDIELLG